MYKNEITPSLEHYLTQVNNPKIRSIIKYAIEGGKCVRGFIVKHIIDTLGNEKDKIHWEPIACIELIHAASLIVDDLPCMDNDSMRRGKISTFVKFGKHEAILISLYMVSESVRLITNTLTKKTLDRCQLLINEWCNLLGKNLVLGQLLDLKTEASEYFNIPINTNNFNDLLIKYKTCSLFSFSFLLGALYAGIEFDVEDFKTMGQHFGMLFQLVDDYTDVAEDDKNVNYVLKHGIQKTTSKYLESRVQFIILLKKYKLDTPKFMQMIEKLDTYIPNLIHKSVQQQTTLTN